MHIHPLNICTKNYTIKRIVAYWYFFVKLKA